MLQSKGYPIADRGVDTCKHPEWVVDSKLVTLSLQSSSEVFDLAIRLADVGSDSVCYKK